MSYLVLARKYRPQTFDEVVGQVPVVKTLQNSLKKNRVAHAILFSGVRGVGKTTLARIMAKAINCRTESEDRPCNICSSCTEITNGRALDLHEIDGASNRGIQEIRELKEKIRFLPTTSKYKIIIIDEVHMLTTEAFNALLKTLEEPPEHVYFMFATTELHKIPITILSRCQRYELKRVASAELTSHFRKIADSEQVTIDASALALIVRESEGSVRDGLSLLDQMFSFGDSSITQEDVIQVLGLTDRNILMTITRSLLENDRTTALSTLESAFEYGLDIKRFNADLLQYFRTLLLIKIGGCSELIDLADEETTLFQEMAGNYTFETIHLKFNLLMQAIEEMRFTSQPQLALETAFLKIIEAGNIVSVSHLLEKIDKVLGATTDDPPTSDQIMVSAEKKNLTVPEVKEHLGNNTKTVPQGNIEEPPPFPDELASQEIEEQEPPLTVNKKQEPEKNSDIEPPSTHQDLKIHPHTHDVRKDWIEFTDYVKSRKIWMAQDLQRADSAKEVGSELHLHYSDPANCTLLREKENRKTLTEFVLDFFQKDLTVRFILPDLQAEEGDTDTETPHKQRQQLMHDPLVQMTVEIFNGQIGDIRIGPRSR